LYLTATVILPQNHELTLGGLIFACLRASPDPSARRWTLAYLVYGYREVIDFALGVLHLPPLYTYLPIVGLPALLLWWGCLRSLVAEQRRQSVAPHAVGVPAAA
jgi:hypothetical protein